MTSTISPVVGLSYSIKQILHRCYNHEMVENNLNSNSVHRKLVLYSHQLFSKTKEIDRCLMTLLGKTKPRVAYIPSGGNLTDLFFQAQKVYYSRYQINLSPCFYLDDSYQPDMLDSLWSADAIHLSGGNTFNFLRGLQTRNLIEPLKQYTAKGGVLIGVSAGSILMTPDIQTSLLCGDVPPDYEINTHGLGLVDFAFVPHLGRHTNLEQIKTYSRQNSQISVVACPDNGGIVVEDDHIQSVGNVVVIKDGVILEE